MNVKPVISGNHRGTALVIALLILVVLTLIGINSINTAIFETSLSGNERARIDAFYAAEAGIQMALDQLPETNPIERTKIGSNSYCWSGAAKDRQAPKPLTSHGPVLEAGSEPQYFEFRRFEIEVTGESSAARQEIEVQAKYGPFWAGTRYNN